MSIVALALRSPWQSWGTTGRYEVRGTELWPTKSGVIGLLANALGRDWEDDVSDLARLRFAIRADRPGIVETDFQTIGAGRFPITTVEALRGGVGEKDPAGPLVWLPYKRLRVKGGKSTATLSERSYLADASFVVALETGPTTIDATKLAASVERPARPLYLGRRSCPPTGRLLLGVYETVSLIESLELIPRLPGADEGSLAALVEASDGEVRSPSLPITFSRAGRRYAPSAYRQERVNPVGEEVLA